MKTAVVVVDMVKDNLELSHHPELAAHCRTIVDQVNALTAGARRRGWPVVFATDSFLPGDPLFRGRMKEHSLRDTEGAEVSGLLTQEPGDTWLPKRRMSSFFKTDLDQMLRLWGGGAGGGLRPDDQLLRAHDRPGRGVPGLLGRDRRRRLHRLQRPGAQRLP